MSHGLGLLLATASLPILVYNAAVNGQAANIVGAALFAGTAIVLYLVSTLYHALPAGRAKVLLNRLDHAAIYLFIAGSYMPFLLGVLRGPVGWALFAAVTAAAVLGVGAKLLDRLKHPLWSTGLYVAMGWMALDRRRAAVRAHAGRRPRAALRRLVAQAHACRRDPVKQPT